MATAAHSNLTDKERKPSIVAEEIIKDAEKAGYPIELFKAKIPEYTSPGPLPAYTEIIKCTEAILSMQEKLNKIRGSIASHNLCNPCMATHPISIEKKAQRMMEEVNRLRAILEFQTQIQASLQTYNLDQSLPIRVQHHKSLLELFETIPKMTNNLNENVKHIEWFLQFQPNKNIEKISTTVTQTFAQAQCLTKQLLEFYTILKKLHSMRQDKVEEESLSNYERSSVSDWKGQKKVNTKLLTPSCFVGCSKKKCIKKE